MKFDFSPKGRGGMIKGLLQGVSVGERLGDVGKELTKQLAHVMDGTI